LARRGWRRRWLPVGERDWFHPPSERFFRFYTEPPVVVYLPDEDPSLDGCSSLFGRIRGLIRVGGFQTWDLGLPAGPVGNPIARPSIPRAISVILVRISGVSWRRVAAKLGGSWHRGRDGITTSRRIPGHSALRRAAAGRVRGHGRRLRGVRPRARHA